MRRVRLLTGSGAGGVLGGAGRGRRPGTTPRRSGIMRTTLADPAATVVLMLVSLVATIASGARWPLWLLLGGLAGNSLSGSV